MSLVQPLPAQPSDDDWNAWMQQHSLAHSALEDNTAQLPMSGNEAGALAAQGSGFKSLQNFANDAAAAAGGVAVGGLYRNGSVVQVRVS